MNTVLIVIMIGYMLFTLLPWVLHKHPLLQKIIHYDPLFLLPHWKMFSKDQTHFRFEYYVLYRDKMKDGCYTPWLALETQRHKPITWLWNPFLVRQTMAEAISTVVLAQLQYPLQLCEVSEVAYAILAQQVLSKPKISTASVDRIFCLVKEDLCCSETESKEVFYSKPYPLKQRDNE